MNHDDPQNPHSDLHPFIEPELEARVVAWVLGEASAFEAAELERLCADNPELAIFKRRIAAVHGLAAKAARPEMQPLRLAPERREKLLRTIGSAEPRTTTPVVAAPPPRRSALHWLTRSYSLAASVAVIFILGLLLIPTVGTVREHARRSPEGMVELRKSQEALIEDDVRRREMAHPSTEEMRRAERAARAEAPIDDDSFGDSIPAFSSRTPLPARPAPTASPRPASAAPREGAFASGGGSAVDSDETMSLSPFEVTASEDVGYSASITLAGNRLNTSISDIGASISVVTNQFLKDTGTTDNQTVLNYTTGTEVAAKRGDFPGWQGIDAAPVAPLDAVTPWQSDLPVSDGEARGPNSVLFGTGSPVGIVANETDAFEPEQLRVRGLADVENTRDAIIADVPWDSFNTSLSQPLVRELEEHGSRQELAKFQAEPSDYVARMTGADLSALREKRKAPVPPKGRATWGLTFGGKPGAPAPDEVRTAVEPVSTFSLHVSDVSFRLAQAALARGEVPDPTRIRPEEFYNAFDYGDPSPAAAEKIACRIDQAAHPVLQQRNLVRIAVRVPATGRGAGQPLRLTVLLDTSGSMEREDRAASVRRALDVLGSLLGPNDRVTVIGFARQPRLLVEALPGDQAAQLDNLAAQTPAEGGTNLEAALELAITKAQQYFHAPAQNRVVLITDGAANLGNAEPERLAEMITTARERGLAFDACGVGTDGLDDAILEALTRKGDGRYYVLDSPDDADAGFARQLAGAFRPAAQNVKLQVRFNPARVAHYRLIGFEQHRLREEDFRNDKVDAAELAAEEAAVAVYQVAVLPEGEGELGDVFVRFRDTAANEMVERSWTMPFEARARAFDQATPTLQLAGVAALLAEKLRGGAMADLVRFDELAPVVNALRGHYAGNARVQELVAMIEQARRMAGE